MSTGFQKDHFDSEWQLPFPTGHRKYDLITRQLLFTKNDLISLGNINSARIKSVLNSMTEEDKNKPK